MRVDARQDFESEQLYGGAPGLGHQPYLSELQSGAEAEILHRASEVIGDRSAAMRWLGTPVRALHYATPISLIDTLEGREAVLTVLGRLEHGVL